MRNGSVASNGSDDVQRLGALGGLGARPKKDEEDMDEDERLLASEEGKKLSSKERRQLRNKVSARAFRSRRKGQYQNNLPFHSFIADSSSRIHRSTRRRTCHQDCRGRRSPQKELGSDGRKRTLVRFISPPPVISCLFRLPQRPLRHGSTSRRRSKYSTIVSLDGRTILLGSEQRRQSSRSSQLERHAHWHDYDS